MKIDNGARISADKLNAVLAKERIAKTLLAEKTGFTSTHIQNICLGRTSMSLGAFARIIQAIEEITEKRYAIADLVEYVPPVVP